MKRVLVLAAVVGAAAAAHANNILWNNGPVFDVPGSPNLSQLFSPPNSTFGYGAQITANNSMADNFVVNVPAGQYWDVKRLTFYMYQTNTVNQIAPFTFTQVDWQITGDHADPISWTSGAPRDGGLVALRVLSTTPTNLQRAIYALEVDVNATLLPGTYVLRWRAAGSLASGPWQPPTVPHAGGDARQSIANGPFDIIQNGTTTNGVELPFTIWGTVVPTPGALAILGMGALLAARRRR